MPEPLQRLLDAVWEHDLPLGPFGDPEDRERAEREREESLTADDALTLLDWVAHPHRLSHWEPARERWLLGLAVRVARYAGRVGCRIGDDRITRRLIRLLDRVESRSAALDGLTELGDPSSFDALISRLGDPRNRLDVVIAIASVATIDQIERLREMGNSPLTPSALRAEIAEILREWEALQRERAAGYSW